MLRLDNVNRSLQIQLGGAVTTNQLPVVASFSDKAAISYNGASQLSTTNNATLTPIVSAPGASIVRDVDYVSVWNKDTVAATINIFYDDNTTLYEIVKVTLEANEQLTYVHGEGWRTIDGFGNVKTAMTATPVIYTANRAVITDAGGLLTTSPTTSTEIGFVNGVTSSIQPQLDAKYDEIVAVSGNIATFGASGATLTDSGFAPGDFQPLDSDLTALAGIATTGVYVITGSGTSTTRTIVPSVAAGFQGTSVVNGDGVAGNPTIGVDINNLVSSVVNLSATDELIVFNGTNNLSYSGQQIADGVSSILGGPFATLSFSTITTPSGGPVVADSPADTLSLTQSTGISITGTAGTDTINIAPANDLAALEALSTIGFSARTGVETWALRTFVSTSSGLVITNGDGVAGDPSFALDSDLQALATIATTGLYAITGTGTSTTRTITGTSNRISVTNGTGVAGDPTIDISATYVGQASITTLGTITTGVWNGTIIATTFGGTGNANGTIPLSKLTAAAAANSINNGDNDQTWNWAMTTAASSAFALTENSASTNGAGSQFLVDISTIAASTANPIRIRAQGNNILTVTNVGVVTLQGADTGTGSAITIKGGNSTTAATAGASATVIGGTSGTSGTGGQALVTGGVGGTTGTGGAVTITGGAGGSASGNAGGVSITGGTPVAGTGGAISISGSSGIGTNQAGGVTSVTGGNATGTGVAGSVTITGGTAAGAGTGGSVNVTAGSTTGGTNGQIVLATVATSTVFRNGDFATPGDAQRGVYILRSQTTNATPTVLFLDGTGGTARLTIPTNSTMTFTVRVAARNVGAAQGAGYRFDGVIRRTTTAASTNLIGSSKTTIAEDNNNWDVNISADTTNGALQIQVTGAGGTTIDWVATVETAEVHF